MKTLKDLKDWANKVSLNGERDDYSISVCFSINIENGDIPVCEKVGDFQLSDNEKIIRLITRE